MKNLRLLFLIVGSLFLTTLSYAQDLKPFISFLRQTPAYINGTVYFNADSILYDDGWTQVKLLKNQPVEFTFHEDYLEVRPRAAFYVKSYKLRVYVDSVSWKPHTGIVSKSQAPADFTGLSSSYVSGKVSEALKGLFEARLQKANAHLKRIRSQNSIGNIFEIAKTIVKIFTASYGQGGSGINIPDYRGEIGLNFLTSQPTAFNLYGMRVGVKERDHYRTGFKFTGDTNGIYPYAVTMSSRDGVDVNYGKEFKIASRLIIQDVSINAGGTGLVMHLGASQVLQGILTAVERAARVSSPGARCENCMEIVNFPTVRVKIEKQVRTAVVSQVKELWPMIQGLNIRPGIYTAFTRRENCRINALTCVDGCNAGTNSSPDRNVCKEECNTKLNACIK